MERQIVNELITNYIKDVNRVVYQPVLNREGVQSTINRGKALFLLLPMLNGDEWDSTTEASSLAIGALQAAIASHDKISSTDATSKSQQLTVLAGDFYSGIHYRLLVAAGEFDFLRSLTNVIAKINEKKTLFTGIQYGMEEDFAEAVRTIEAGCVSEFLSFYGYQNYIPLAEAGLPLLALMEADSGSSETSHHTGYAGMKNLQEIKRLFARELSYALAEDTHLHLAIKDEIRMLTSSPIGKLL